MTILPGICVWFVFAVCQPEDIYLLHNVYGGVYIALLCRELGCAFRICHAFGLHWVCFYDLLVSFWVGIQVNVFKIFQTGKCSNGPASGVVRRIPFPFLIEHKGAAY